MIYELHKRDYLDVLIVEGVDAHFSIPLGKRKLSFKTSGHGRYIGKVEVIETHDHYTSGKDILYRGHSSIFQRFLSCGSESFKEWNKIKPELKRKFGINGENISTARGLMQDIISLLKKLDEYIHEEGENYSARGLPSPINEKYVWHRYWIRSELEEELGRALTEKDYYNSYFAMVKELFNKTLSKLPGKGGFPNFDRLALAYTDPELYSSPDMFSPPAERRSHVLRLELTQGCDYNKCNFCSGYDGVSYKEKSFQEFQKHLKQVAEVLGDYMKEIRRVFIGGANALNVEQKKLLEVLDSIKDAHRKSLGEWYSPLRRIAVYGRTDAIIDKGKERLRELKWDGLNLVYWGVESGSDEVLKYINKGTTLDEMLLAGEIANSAKMDLSVTIMPGAGGVKYSDAHVRKTIEFINEVQPKFITFMGINPAPSTKYARRMKRAKRNRPLTDFEIIDQVRTILKGIVPYDGKVGMFGPDIDQVGHNPTNFNVRLNKRTQLKRII